MAFFAGAKFPRLFVLLHFRPTGRVERCPLTRVSLFPNLSSPAGAKFEADMEQMRSDLAVSPPLPGAYSPRKNQMCVAKFVDGLW